MKPWLIFALAAVACTSTAMIFGTDHSKPPAFMNEVWGLTPDKVSKTFEVQQIGTTVPGNVLWPGDKPAITFQIVNKSKRAIRGKARFDLIQYKLRTLPTGDGMFSYAMDKVADREPTSVMVDVPAGGYQNVTVRPSVPARFGGYAMILDIPGEGRKLAAGLTRTMAQESRAIQYPSMSLDEMDPAVLERIGIRAVRYGLDYKPTTDPGYADYMAYHRRKLGELKKHNVTVLLMFLGGGPQPLGQMRSFLNDNGEGPMGYPGDGAWLPSADPDFAKSVEDVCSQFGWPKGPVTAVHLWNEPWEGSSISGWGADMLRYRDIYRAMAKGVLAARKKGADVLVGGCDSSSNAMDKLFPDESREFLPIFDFVSLHYQGLSSPQHVPIWRDRRGPHGPVRQWDTESWAANTDERVLPRLASWRAAGYDRVMGVDAANVSTRWEVTEQKADGKTVRIDAVHTWSPAVAVSAMARLVGDKPFRKLLFSNGLPWVFTFGDPKKPDDGVAVVTGDIGGANNAVFRTVRRQPNASLTIPASPAYRLLDADGNSIAPVDGRYSIVLNEAGYYFLPGKKKGDFVRLESALRAARVVGVGPVEVMAKDMTAAVTERAVLRLKVTNVLNRPIRGSVSATLAGVRLTSAKVSLRANQTSVLEIPVKGVRPRGDNVYPLLANLNFGKDGQVNHKEAMRCNVIARRTIKVDGDLNDWGNALPQTIVDAAAAGPSQTEQAWFPYKKFDTSVKKGFAAGYLAYDAKNFYFAAKIADNTPDPGTLRHETRDDDQFFYPPFVTKVPRRPEDGQREMLTWPEGVRRYTYRKDPILPVGNGQGVFDNVQIAFNAIPESDVKAKGAYSFPRGTMPRYAAYKDTDYEYALNNVAPQFGGGTEIWRLEFPGMPRKHFYPRQPKSKFEGPVKNGNLVVRHEGNTRIVECRIPWSELAWVKKRLDAGHTVKFTFRVNDNDGPGYELAANRSVSGTNGRTFHCDWVRHWTNELEFGWGK